MVGAHLTGMPLNHQLVTCGAHLLESTRTAPRYRLYLLAKEQPPKPGLVESGDAKGHAIDVEVWNMPTGLRPVRGGIPAPLGIGTIELADGSRVHGIRLRELRNRAARAIFRNLAAGASS